MSSVWFIRHGESRGNAGHRTATPTSTLLTAKGSSQAQFLRHCFTENIQPSLVVTSRYTRTKQTAEPILRMFPETPVEEWPLHEFICLSPSKFMNSTMAERRPAVRNYWESADPDYVDGPDAESFISFIGRIQQALDELRMRRLTLTVVFSHGFVMRAIAWLLLTRPTVIDSDQMARYWSFFQAVDVPNASILRVDLDDPFGPRLGEFDVAHLPLELVST